MSTPLARAAALILMLVAVLAQSPTQSTSDSQTSATSSATSTASAPSIASPTSSVTTQISSSEARVHVVKAGAGGFHFEPAELANVSVGDVVRFEFYPPDHSVARAEYGSACVPYEYTGRGRTGFWSETQWVKTPNDVSTQHDFSGSRLLSNGARLPIGTSRLIAQSRSSTTVLPQIRARESRWSASLIPMIHKRSTNRCWPQPGPTSSWHLGILFLMKRLR